MNAQKSYSDEGYGVGKADERDALVQANYLVSRKEFAQAIVILQNCITQYPESRLAARALGKTYLLNRQPALAVTYLRQAIDSDKAYAEKTTESLPNNATDKYAHDSFDEDDYAYVEDVENRFHETEFSIQDDSLGERLSSPTSLSDAPTLPTLSLKNRSSNLKPNQNASQIKIAYKNRKLTDATDIAPLESPAAPQNIIQFSPKKEQSEKNLKLNAGDSLADDLLPEVAAKINQTKAPSIEQLDLFSDPNAEDDYLISYFDQHVDNESEGLGHSLPSLDDYESSIEFDDDFVGELISDDLDESWGDDLDYIDQLDDFQEDLARDDHAFVEENTITRFERAGQVAAEVIIETDWRVNDFALLQQIFYENGYSMARKAMVRIILDGAVAEEIALARELKIYWKENEHLWMTFHKVKTNLSGAQTDAAYQQLSWAEALRLIRSFGDIPDLDEAIGFIEALFERWYQSNFLRKVYKAFFRYLTHRLGHDKRTLSSDYFFSFDSIDEFNQGLESDSLLSAISPESRALASYGINLNERKHENSLDVIIDEATLNDRFE